MFLFHSLFHSLFVQFVEHSYVASISLLSIGKHSLDCNYKIYQYFQSEEFLDNYHNFCSSIILEHFNGKAEYQIIPSLRIQYPGAQSVNFHNDIMYGHGQDIINIWVPLVSVYDSKSMYVIDETNSISSNSNKGCIFFRGIDLL